MSLWAVGCQGERGQKFMYLKKKAFLSPISDLKGCEPQSCEGEAWVMVAFGGFHPFDLESEDSSCGRDTIWIRLFMSERGC